MIVVVITQFYAFVKLQIAYLNLVNVIVFSNINKNKSIGDLLCVEIRKKKKCARSTVIAGHPTIVK